MTVPILYRDERCVAVDKPAGMVVHRGEYVGDTGGLPLLQTVRNQIGARVHAINRLDRGTSGIVLFALDEDAARELQAAWPDADKRYLAITRGHPPEHVLLDHPVPKPESDERVDAVSEIWRREIFGRYALVEVRPLTGRWHQIRRHLKHLSCPLIGDVKYGKGEHNRIFRDQHAFHRLALHCTHLTFTHPDGSRIAVECPLPAEFEHALASARAAYPSEG